MDALARVGCPSGFDFIPYHPLHLQRLGWADFVPIVRDTTLYVRDFRRRPTIYRVAPVAGRNDFFALYNLQRTHHDSVVAGEGLAVTHALDKTNDGWNIDDIWDMETPWPMYVKAANTKCPALPHQEDPIKGVDSLQCMLGGDETHLWPYPESQVLAFGPTTNPSTGLYATSAVAPYDSQAVTSNLRFQMISLEDSVVSGKEMVRVVVDLGWFQPDSPERGAPVIGGDTGEGIQVRLTATGAGMEFDIKGDLRGFDNLEVYAPTGRAVRSMRLREVSDKGWGHATIVWDRRNESGPRVANGVYFYCLRGPRGTAASGRFVLVR